MKYASTLPEVEKKDVTLFSEFKLSKTNRNEKENLQGQIDKVFKAKSLNKKILEEADFKVVENKRNIEMSPFNLKVDERLKNKDKSKDYLEDFSKSSFKAKQMPNYKFFEPTKE